MSRQVDKVVLVVLDGLGIGGGPGDSCDGESSPNSFGHVWRAVGGMNIPFLGGSGLGRVAGVPLGCWEASLDADWGRAFGRSRQVSEDFCESYSAHWEMAGVVAEQVHHYPEGLPSDCLAAVEEQLGVPVLGNRPYYPDYLDISEELVRTHSGAGGVILLTDKRPEAVGTFAVYADIRVLEPPRLFLLTRQLRDVLRGRGLQGRACARCLDTSARPIRLLDTRLDLPFFEVPGRTVLSAIHESGRFCVATGKVGVLFNNTGFTECLSSWNSEDIFANTCRALEVPGSGLVWANLNELNRPYGSSCDVRGWARTLEKYDVWLSKLAGQLGLSDLLIVTGDHGRDPTLNGAQTREWTPLLCVGQGVASGPLGCRRHSDIAATLRDIWSLDFGSGGESFAAGLFRETKLPVE